MYIVKSIEKWYIIYNNALGNGTRKERVMP